MTDKRAEILSPRQEMLLGLIVHEYVNVPIPVSSKALVDNYDLGVSSATVRNDMAALEEAGLLASPHTSAGRVPTEAGYRYFVQKILNDNDLSTTEKLTIRHQFHQTTHDLDQLLRLAASVLANTTHSASLVTSPVIEQAIFKHISLIQTHGRAVLMVLVIEGGAVRQQMLSLAEPVPQEVLTQIAARLNEMCAGMSADRLRLYGAHQPALEQEILELACDLLERAAVRSRTVYYDGLVNILDPDNSISQLQLGEAHDRAEVIRAVAEADMAGARQTLRLLEEQHLLEEIMAEVIAPEADGVQVIIAGDGRWDELSQTSMVISRYGIFGHTTGALCVLGPVRLRYGRAISAVRWVAGLMNDIMIDIHGEGGSLALGPPEA